MRFSSFKLFICFNYMIYFSLGCGMGYGYLHRIPVRTIPQNKDIPAPPVIKPAVVNNVMVCIFKFD